MFTKYLSELFQQRNTFHLFFLLQEHDIEGQKQNGEKPRENKVKKIWQYYKPSTRRFFLICEHLIKHQFVTINFMI